MISKFIMILGNNLCNKIPLELTENCNEPTSSSRFQIQSAKRLNLKKPLNGRIKILYKSKSSNDYMKLKKCFQLSHEFCKDTFSIVANFVENELYGEISIIFQNNTSIKMNLNENKQIHNVIKYYDGMENLIQLSHCEQSNSKWVKGNLK